MLQTYSKTEAQKIRNILLSIPTLQLKTTNYWTAVDEVYANADIAQILESRGVDSHNLKLSAGTSVLNTSKQLLSCVISSLKKHTYRFYMPSAGSMVARSALALRESYLAGIRSALSPCDVIMTTGSTGAISSIFEVIATDYPQGTVLIAGPTYYLYRFCAQYYKLNYLEVSKVTKVDSKRSSWLCFEEMLSSIRDGVKLVCIVNPTNPSGEYYTEQQLERIFIKAKRIKAIVLVDELFGFLDYTDGLPRVSALKAAESSKTSDTVIIVNGFSKTTNLAGLRIGYIATKNTVLIRKLTRINQVRSCFPIGDYVDDMIILDTQFRIAKCAQKKGVKQRDITNLLKKMFNNTLSSNFWGENEEFWKTMDAMNKYYESELKYAKQFLSELIVTTADTKVGFNSLVNVRGLDQVNMFDFSLNCYLATGVKVELGPSYVLGQKTWESNEQYGFWVRLTTARDKNVYRKTLTLFNEFTCSYLRSKRFAVTTNLYFD